MKNNVIETVMGAVVLAVAAVFLAFAYNSSQWKTTEGYEISAKFDRIDGLMEGSDVRLSGVKVGTVDRMTLDPETFLAVVSMNINPNIKLPEDTVAEVVSDGLLGGKYLALVPGGDEHTIPAGGVIKFTQASVNLESLIGQLIFSSQDHKKEEHR